MRHLLGAVAAIVTTMNASTGIAADVPVEFDGRSFVVKAVSLQRLIEAKDREAGNQASPLGCSLLYYANLAKGDIAGAAAISADPQATAAKLTQYRERLGAEEFQKTMAAYFTSGNVVLAELTLRDTAMLVVKTKEYTAGQICVKNAGVWRWADRPPAEEGRALGRVLNMIQTGKLKL